MTLLVFLILPGGLKRLVAAALAPCDHEPMLFAFDFQSGVLRRVQVDARRVAAFFDGDGDPDHGG